MLILLFMCRLTFAQDENPLNTTRETVGWVNGPNYRSTSDIIFSCVLSTGLCVWSALHLNIPGAHESVPRQWLRNTGWICLGIFGPELIMFVAYKNYAAARSLQSVMESKLGCPSCDLGGTQRLALQSDCCYGAQATSLTNSEEAPSWTMLHGYYAVMGGFVFEVDSYSASTILNTPRNATRLTITPQGLQLLAECGLVPSIEARTINDKNKSDNLAKAIVILQAGWMIVQCVSRLVYNLPVTLVEVNTVGHVICALFIYSIWWRKPHDINQPTILKSRWTSALTVYMIMSSDTEDIEGWREWTSLKPPLLPELTNLSFRPDTNENLQADAIDEEASMVLNVGVMRMEPHAYESYAHKTGFGSLVLSKNPDLAVIGLKRQMSFLHHLKQSKLDKETQVARWRLALDAMEMFPHLFCRMKQLQSRVAADIQSYQPQVMLQERASNWPTKGSIPSFPGKLIGMALWLASIAFGAVHIAAWNEYFPSTIEKWLWRSSSLYLAWAGSLWLVICFLGTISKRFNSVWDRCIMGRASKKVYVCLVPICITCGAVYAFARMFLVIESVAALRKMPPKAYVTPDWPDLIPHL